MKSPTLQQHQVVHMRTALQIEYNNKNFYFTPELEEKLQYYTNIVPQLARVTVGKVSSLLKLWCNSLSAVQTRINELTLFQRLNYFS